MATIEYVVGKKKCLFCDKTTHGLDYCYKCRRCRFCCRCVTDKEFWGEDDE